MKTITIKVNKEEDAYFSDNALASDILVGSVMEVFDYKTEDMRVILYERNGNPFSGELIISYSSGDLFFNCTYKDGKKEGLETTYYPNNIVGKKINFKDNKGNGDTYIYDTYGRISIYYQLKEDCPNGVIKYYFPNGNIKEEGEQISLPSDGLLTLPNKKGIWKYYFENGQLREEGEWQNLPNGSIKHVGEWKYYNEKGELTDKKNY